MPSFVVRIKGYEGDETSGRPYAAGPINTVIFAEDATQARSIGAMQLGVGGDEVDVIPWASNSDPEGLVQSLKEEA